MRSPRKEMCKAMIDVGLTGRALAKKVGISESFMSMTRTGLFNPKPEIQQKIAEALQCPVERIFPEEAHRG